MNGVQVKKVAGYMLLPGVIPRTRKLFTSGFGYVAFLIANVFNIVRLLPADHPYMNPANIGKFGIRHVIAQAANNLVISRNNIDQIIIFTLILVSVVITALQIVLALYGYIFKPAMASMFITPQPRQDVAFMLLDEVFGVPGLFNSCIATGQTCKDLAAGQTLPAPGPNGNFPWAFHIALHSMLSFYSMGLLFIGILIFFYYLLVVVVETATTGHPFGQRFQNVWVPIRLVVALGLLVPVSHGLNSSQYIVLYTAKYASGFATNAWLRYNHIVETGSAGQRQFPGGANANPTGEYETLLARPVPPSTAPIVQAMSIVHACTYAYWKTNYEADGKQPAPPSDQFDIKPYLVKNPVAGKDDGISYIELSKVNYQQAVNFYNKGNITIVFGKRGEDDPATTGINEGDAYKSHPGQVMPLCGSISIPVNYLKDLGEGAQVGGADAIQNFWFDLVKQMWADASMQKLSHYYVEWKLNRAPQKECQTYATLSDKPKLEKTNSDGSCELSPLSLANRQKLVDYYNVKFKNAVDIAWEKYRKSAKDVKITKKILARGWAGAGIWYNTIADINGAFVSAIFNVPLPSDYPALMQLVSDEKKKTDTDTSPKEQYSCDSAERRPNIKDPAGMQDAHGIACAMGQYIAWWNVGGADQAKTDTTPIGNFIMDVMNMLFGTEGLIGLRTQNGMVHPLAQLTALGKALVESAIIYVGVGVISAAGGGLIGALGQQQIGALLTLASDLSISLAFIGLTAGFILYYVLPFLPFLYFFFAVATWIKTIFEAMVGAPLWALAHLRLDGEGLPGDAAQNGYLLLFDLAVRPILSVISLIVAMLILTAQVRVLNLLWELVVDNLTGFTGDAAIQAKGTARGIVDGYFFTVLYAMIVYMLATSSFKLIDAIPDNILRYFGGNVSSFSGINPDATEGLTRYAAMGGITFGQQMTQSVKTLAAQTGGALGTLLNPPKGPPGR